MVKNMKKSHTKIEGGNTKRQSNTLSVSHKMKITSKLKKRFKFTLKKLKINEDTLNKAIECIRLQNDTENQRRKILRFKNYYLYFILKNKIDNNTDKEKSLKKINNKLLKLTNPMQNEIYIIDDFTDDEKNILANTSNNSLIRIMSNEEFTEKIKRFQSKQILIKNLNYICQVIISNNKFNFLHKKLLRKDLSHLGILYYQKKKCEYIQKLVNYISHGASLLKSLNRKTFKIKAASCVHKFEEVKANIKNLIFKSTSLILEQSQKHNSIVNIVIKSEDSIPFSIFGETPVEDIDIFDL